MRLPCGRQILGMSMSAAPAASRSPVARTGAATLGILVAIAIWVGPLAAVGDAHAGAEAVATDPAGILLAWSLDPLILVLLAASLAAYFAMVRSVDRSHRDNRWSRWRTLFFVVGIVSVALALLSPIDTYSDELLTVHMVQHLLLTSIAPALVAAAGVGTLALRAASDRTRDRVLLPILHSRPVEWITFPLVGWILYAAVMWGTHFSQIYNLALVDDRVHALEHLAYFFAALLFWYPVFSPDPTRWKMRPIVSFIYVITQMPQMSFLAVALLSATSLLYPAYAGRGALFGVDALADQQTAAALMWILGDATFLVALALIAREWIKQEEAEAVRVDARLERERREREGG